MFALDDWVKHLQREAMCIARWNPVALDVPHNRRGEMMRLSHE